jgi:hypothetical protein
MVVYEIEEELRPILLIDAIVEDYQKAKRPIATFLKRTLHVVDLLKFGDVEAVVLPLGWNIGVLRRPARLGEKKNHIDMARVAYLVDKISY